MKTYKYHTRITWKENGNEYSMQSQLYQIGVYVIINNNAAMQSNCTPSAMASGEKKLQKAFEAGKITDLVLHNQIKVAEVDGLWKEIET